MRNLTPLPNLISANLIPCPSNPLIPYLYHLTPFSTIFSRAKAPRAKFLPSHFGFCFCCKKTYLILVLAQPPLCIASTSLRLPSLCTAALAF